MSADGSSISALTNVHEDNDSAILETMQQFPYPGLEKAEGEGELPSKRGKGVGILVVSFRDVNYEFGSQLAPVQRLKFKEYFPV